MSTDLYDYNKTRAHHHFQTLQKDVENRLSKSIKFIDPITCLQGFGLTRFLDALERAAITDDILSLPAFTLYVPVNEAFDRLSTDDREKFLGSSESCEYLVKSHTAVGYTKARFENDPSYFELDQRTLLGNLATVSFGNRATIDVTYRPGKPILVAFSDNPGAVAVVLYQLQFSHGQMCIIDAVLGSSDLRLYDVIDGKRAPQDKELNIRDIVA